MKVTSSYKVKLSRENTASIQRTVTIYRDAVSYVIDVVDKEWERIAPVLREFGAKSAQIKVEHLIHATKNNIPEYDFDEKFVKMPSYLRRAAISDAIGAASSYRSNFKNWEEGGRQGKAPSLQTDRACMPTFFKDNMSHCEDMLAGKSCEVCLKLFNGKDWVWIIFHCRYQDVKYLHKYWSGVKASAPTLQKINHSYYLRFAYEEKCDLSLHDAPLKDQVILAVDLGINTDATCSVMKSDGTVIARKFINFPIEKDRRDHTLNKIKGLQQKYGYIGARKTWKKATFINDDHAQKVAKTIVDFAVLYNVNTIVFEYLDMKGKKRGGRKQKLTLWRKNGIQKIVEHKAHRNLIRISHICAWGTSKLAFDGSGETTRYISVDGQKENYSLCEFPSTEEGKRGKIYNCDLNASYNIGARYFLRAMCDADPSLKDRLPSTPKRTYSDLIQIAQIQPGNRKVS